MDNQNSHTPKSIHGTWSSRWTFILAATGSAVGLGNIWKFPYIAGENGGGAFVLVYLLCIVIVGIPIMMAEVFLGRNARRNPVNAVEVFTRQSGASHNWRYIGVMGVIAGLLIMSFYSVVAGWALHYVFASISGTFTDISAAGSDAFFGGLLGDPKALLGWHSTFTLMTFIIVASGVSKGLGAVAKYMMPFLFLALAVLLVYGFLAGNFKAGVMFLFTPNFSALTGDSILIAMGHAFFTLSLGMGAIMAYGAYMPSSANIGKTILTVGILDTLVALVAGLAIFPIVFANPTIEVGAGPGLLFVSLPIAFGSMPLGLLIGTLFFALVAVAAWSSAVSLIEPAIAWLIENKGWKRIKAAGIVAGCCWLLGLLTVASFGPLAEFKPAWLLYFTPFDFFDFLTSQIMLPLGGVLIALLVAWKAPAALLQKEFGFKSQKTQTLLLFLLRFVSPTLVLLIMAIKLFETLSQLGA
ncbi:sodium-dependent transporter [Marinagarivorans algicola]|uniref:sodium-dependent transporter n=1 Tax=Marinagarivorans algicola TaxID=1513270 RepID=UPI0006B498AD|nr:sodium-dependent transporter [Marinagarivorans algicola]